MCFILQNKIKNAILLCSFDSYMIFSLHRTFFLSFQYLMSNKLSISEYQANYNADFSLYQQAAERSRNTVLVTST